MSKCKVCDKETEVVFNINFKATPICESCATNIFAQQAIWYTQQKQTLPMDNVDDSCEICKFTDECRFKNEAEDEICKYYIKM